MDLPNDDEDFHKIIKKRQIANEQMYEDKGSN